jgi:cell division protein FtsZ
MSDLSKPRPPAELCPRLTVIGVGGAGCNAVNNMIASGLAHVHFVVANTDAQSLATSSCERRVQLGVTVTEGLGAGSSPQVGEAAAEEALDALRAEITGAHMLFITAGMGGGTGTGAAGVVARVARELGILTVAIVTRPFSFEGQRRQRIADAGVAELARYVDTMIVIPNQNLFRVATERTTFADAFILADQVLYSGVACVVDLIVKEGLINLDFADVRAVLAGMGTAMMGTGEAAGPRRAIEAAEEAISNPLLDDVSMQGARGLLVSISGGRDLTLYEVDEAASRVRAEVDPDANIIVGATFDETLGDRVRVSIVASGMSRAERRDAASPSRPPIDRGQAERMPTERADGAPLPYGSERSRAESLPVVVHTATATPGMPPAPAPPPSDFQDRLSAALWSDAVADEDPDRSGATWEGPGRVTIEPQPPFAAGPHGPPAGQMPPYAPPAPEPAGGFVPALPADVRPGAGRRVPDIAEFPPHVQRAYQEAQPEAPSRRPGLIGRLAGMGRRRGDDSGPSRPDLPESETDGGAPARVRAGEGARGSTGDGRHGTAATHGQIADMPRVLRVDPR